MKIERYYRRYGKEELIRAAAAIAARGETAIVPVQIGPDVTYRPFYRGQPLEPYGSEAAARRALGLRELWADGINARIKRAIANAELRGWFGKPAQRRARLDRMREYREVGR